MYLDTPRLVILQAPVSVLRAASWWQDASREAAVRRTVAILRRKARPDPATVLAPSDIPDADVVRRFPDRQPVAWFADPNQPASWWVAELTGMPRGARMVTVRDTPEAVAELLLERSPDPGQATLLFWDVLVLPAWLVGGAVGTPWPFPALDATEDPAPGPE